MSQIPNGTKYVSVRRLNQFFQGLKDLFMPKNGNVNVDGDLDVDGNVHVDGNISLKSSGGTVSHVKDPVQATDVANKRYVDEKSVFVAEYYVTTFDDVVDAYNAGKTIVCKYTDEDAYIPLSYTETQGGTVDVPEYFLFSGVSLYDDFLNNMNFNEITLEDDGAGDPTEQWSSGNFNGELVSNKVTTISSLSTDKQYPSAKCMYTAVNKKQDKLIGTQGTQGQNIKTINGTTVLGSGNISVQETLSSGTNIKTVNNQSLLGPGNITISGSGTYIMYGEWHNGQWIVSNQELHNGITAFKSGQPVMVTQQSAYVEDAIYETIVYYDYATGLRTGMDHTVTTEN